MPCKKQIPRILLPTINKCIQDENTAIIKEYLKRDSPNMSPNRHSHLNKLLISRPVSQYRNDNVHPVKDILQTSLSLSPYHERKSREKTWHNSKEEILEAPREREREMHKSNRSWRFMARYG